MDEVQRKPLAAQVVFDAAQHQRAAVALGAGAHFVGGHPDGAHDAGVQAAARHGVAQITAKSQAHIGDVFAGGGPLKARQVQPDQRGGLESMGGFL